MKSRRVGQTHVSPLGLGCWAIGGPFWGDGGQPLGWGNVDDQESIRAIEAGIDQGINFIDTADVYGAGHSERIIAKAIRGKRDKVILATKFGFTFDEATKIVSGENASAEYIHDACDASLSRLQTDYIDLYQIHLNDFDPQWSLTVRKVLDDLVGQGKIRSYGWSTDFVERAEIFAGGEHFVAVQFEHNVLKSNETMADFCQAHNLAGINRGPLAMGLLSGNYSDAQQFHEDDIRRKNPEWLAYFENGKPTKRFTEAMTAIRDILTSRGRSMIQGALAWLWATSPNNIPIPGFRTVAQVTHNAEAMSYGPMDDNEVAELTTLLAPAR